MQQPLKARVRNGRLVLDEPTDLPEGEEVELVLADVDDVDVDLSEDERKQLDESIGVAAPIRAALPRSRAEQAEDVERSGGASTFDEEPATE